MIEKIDSFSGDYEFLSNMYPCNITYDGIVYKCSESAYQAQKCPELAYTFKNLDGYAAKKLGRQVNIRPDWDNIKLIIMGKIVYTKFTQNKALAEKLLTTDNAELIEGNWWSDTYWGVCTNKKYDHVGENYLGKILMFVREILKANLEKYKSPITPKLTDFSIYADSQPLESIPTTQYEYKYDLSQLNSDFSLKHIDDMYRKIYNLELEEYNTELENTDKIIKSNDIRLSNH